MSDGIVAECRWGPFDGEQWEIPDSQIMVVIRCENGYRIRISRMLQCGDLPKKFRDDPNVLGWYNYVVEFSPYDMEDDTDGLNVEVRAFHMWYTKKDQISEIVQKQVKDSRRRNKKPGWMLNGNDLDDDYYDDDDPAEDWKRK